MKKDFFDVEKFLSGLRGFIKKLQDDESKKLFEIRFKYFLNRDIDILERNLVQEAMKYKESAYCLALENYFDKYPKNKSKSAVLFGAGIAGHCSLRTLKVLGIDVKHIVDNGFETIKEIEGEKVESPSILAGISNDVYVIVSVVDYQSRLEIYYQLLSLGVQVENIFLVKEGFLWGDYGLQYFDLQEMPINSKGEIFVDAGCFDGMSAYNALKWAKNKLNKVYAFEPDKNNYQACEAKLKNLGCEYELINAATWSEKTELAFEENSFGQASRISQSGENHVFADSIDNILNGRPATFIKLDVEGSELEALKGAEKTIKQYRPKLAVSLYHKPEDIVTLPIFIESLGMDYKYYIRHYQTRWCETILYAF